MFEKQIGINIREVSHKLIEKPNQSVYFNHIHHHCELLLFLSGAASYNIDGQIFRPVPYDLLFIPAATYHYLIPNDAVAYENYVIGIDPSFLPPEQYKKLFSAPLLLNVKEDAELLSFFTRLDFYDKHYTEKDFDACAESLIREITTYCAYRKDALNAKRSEALTYTEKIARYIMAHLEEEIDAERIARHFLLSRSYVQNLFSEQMHIGLKKYVMQKKIYAAEADIRRGISPTAAAEKYAFSDYSVFYRLYKKTFGVSPRQK